MKMPVAFGSRDFLFCSLMLLLFIKSVRASVKTFSRADPDLFKFGKPKSSCASETLQNPSVPRQIGCAQACSLQSRCLAFVHDSVSLRCFLLQSPCSMSPKQLNLRMMVRKVKKPTWEYNGSKYIVITEKGNYDKMLQACALYGMYLWIPNTQEEMNFIYNMSRSLSDKYKSRISASEISYDLWIGVVYLPNSGCMLQDFFTPCIVTSGFPELKKSKVAESCASYFEENGSFHWRLHSCSHKLYGICEKR